MDIIQKPIKFLTEVRIELGKVSWSTRQELIDSTIVVIAITAVMSIFIGLIDIVLSKLLSILFK
jgi:preprotein translocase subunit SecE